MHINKFVNWWIVTFLLLAVHINVVAQYDETGSITGKLKINNSWASQVYLSYIPTFDDMYSMSNQMIIAEADIDSLGSFEFDLNFLPEASKLFRLHIRKKGDARTSLIIGGMDENHWFFIANRQSKISFKAGTFIPPFRNIIFNEANENVNFQQITDLVFRKDSIASVSGASKRKFVEERLNETLLAIADSSSDPMISLYALYSSDIEINYAANSKFYSSYLEKWEGQDDAYFNAFRAKIPVATPAFQYIKYLFGAILLLMIGFLIGKFGRFNNRRIKKLSIQERKIYDLLKQGASNQEISDQYNIGISTVKSHVSSILSKLNVKSRKEIMNFK